MVKGLLHGMRVIDFTWIGAGSYTTKMLADMGADVVKIESSTYPDSLRLSGPFKDKIPGVNRSGYFADRNTSKRSMVLNLKSPEGIALAKQLIADCDVVANNFTPGTMERLGLDYQTLASLNPRLIYIGMSTQGSDGPENNAVGYGLTISALTGLHHLTGLPGREPVGTGTNYPDHVPNPGHAAFAILAALRHRRRSGRGQRIDIAQTEPTVAVLATAILVQSANGRTTGPAGSRNEVAAPRGVYPCAGEDRWIAISVESNAQWSALVATLANPALHNPNWCSAHHRRRDQDEIDAIIAKSTVGFTSEELMATLQEHGVPAGAVLNAADIVSTDPQLRHRGHWRRLNHREMGPMLYNGLPFQFANQALGPYTAAPLLGEHTTQICKELLCMSDENIADLRAKSVFQ
jgi:benzylsuccinate CoA-transferase BbsF subunit